MNKDWEHVIPEREVNDIDGCKTFGIMYRMKYLQRWSLMHNVWSENVMEHSYMVTVIAHALAELHNHYCESGYWPKGAPNSVKVDVKSVLLKALYHDCAEAITGDVPTPIKHYSVEAEKSYRNVERAALNKLQSDLPDPLKGSIGKAMSYASRETTSEAEFIENQLVKAADNISALVKCIEELRADNEEFYEAYTDTVKTLEQLEGTYPEVQWFCENCLDAFGRSRQAMGIGIAFQEGRYDPRVPLSEQNVAQDETEPDNATTEKVLAEFTKLFKDCIKALAHTHKDDDCAGAEPEVAGGDSEGAQDKPEVAGAVPEVAGAVSEVAGAVSEVAGVVSEVAGVNPKDGTPKCEVAGGTSEGTQVCTGDGTLIQKSGTPTEESGTPAQKSGTPAKEDGSVGPGVAGDTSEVTGGSAQAGQGDIHDGSVQKSGKQRPKEIGTPVEPTEHKEPKKQETMSKDQRRAARKRAAMACMLNQMVKDEVDTYKTKQGETIEHNKVAETKPTEPTKPAERPTEKAKGAGTKLKVPVGSKSVRVEDDSVVFGPAMVESNSKPTLKFLTPFDWQSLIVLELMYAKKDTVAEMEMAGCFSDCMRGNLTVTTHLRVWLGPVADGHPMVYATHNQIMSEAINALAVMHGECPKSTASKWALRNVWLYAIKRGIIRRSDITNEIRQLVKGAEQHGDALEYLAHSGWWKDMSTGPWGKDV